MNPDVHEPGVTLPPADAARLDALLEGPRLSLSTESGRGDGGPRAGGTGEAGSDGVARVLALLGLDAPDPGEVEESLVAATVAASSAGSRGAARPGPGAEPVTITMLGDDDAAAVDAVLAAGGGAGPVPPGLGERAARARQVFGLLERAKQAPGDDRHQVAAGAEVETAEGGDALVQRTLAAVAAQRQRERFAAQVAMYAEPRRTLGVGWRQILTSAAVLLVGVSLLFPALDNQRQRGQQAACMGNLGLAGQQMNAYAVDHAGMLPRGPVGDSWIKAGQADAVDETGRYQSNSAHLYLLIREAYVAPERLACASNSYATTGLPGSGQRDWASPAAISYSYQNQYTPQPIRVQQSLPQLAVLADKNPLFVVERGRLVFDPQTPRDARTTLHRARGQNILTLDGRVRWNQAPTIGDDNVWQIAGHRGAYHGNEAPADAQRDSFLVP